MKKPRHKANAIPGGGAMPIDRAKDKKKSDAKALNTEGNIAGDQTGTSIFDPVLAETMYYWFCPPSGAIIDPFAGGSTRGIVAGYLGHRYTGIDLSARQLAANRVQWQAIMGAKRSKAEEESQPTPIWINGDSAEVAKLAAGEYDFLFSCPPYADLEVYSEDPRDISRLDYKEFLPQYRAIVKSACALLKDNRFAAFVVGDLRDSKGFYCNFVSDTIAAFQDAGLKLYNEMILVTAVGSLPIRVGRQFESARKVGKTHQNCVVFFKGDPKTIADNFPKEVAITKMPDAAAIPASGGSIFGEEL